MPLAAIPPRRNGNWWPSRRQSPCGGTSADVTTETIADVIEPGYALGERLIRAAKVAVSVPEG